MEERYTIRQACNFFGIKVRTMREWIRRGKIEAKKDSNGQWYITAEEIARMTNHADKN